LDGSIGELNTGVNIMGMSDHDYVNFSEDYELNYHLKKVSKRETERNRSTLKIMGDELKAELGKTRLTHAEFHPYVNKQKDLLE
jgi:hypothetical protein